MICDPCCETAGVGEAEMANRSLFSTSEIRPLYLECLSSFSLLFRHFLGGIATKHPKTSHYTHPGLLHECYMLYTEMKICCCGSDCP